MGAFCGKTTLPLDLDGKQLIVLVQTETTGILSDPRWQQFYTWWCRGMYQEQYLELTHLVVALDELPTLYLPALVNWLNENREDGFCGILGYQNFSSVRESFTVKN